MAKREEKQTWRSQLDYKIFYAPVLKSQILAELWKRQSDSLTCNELIILELCDINILKS